uniref:magnesium transporter n=1 Tax=Streptomyces polyasparticus TaxID=2767826 RepID=UPI0034D61DB1
MIQAVAILAAFMPLVTDMDGNAATQSTTLFARGLAFGHIDLSRFRSVLLRECTVGTLIALVERRAPDGCAQGGWAGVQRPYDRERGSPEGTVTTSSFLVPEHAGCASSGIRAGRPPGSGAPLGRRPPGASYCADTCVTTQVSLDPVAGQARPALLARAGSLPRVPRQQHLEGRAPPRRRTDFHASAVGADE